MHAWSTIAESSSRANDRPASSKEAVASQDRVVFDPVPERAVREQPVEVHLQAVRPDVSRPLAEPGREAGPGVHEAPPVSEPREDLAGGSEPVGRHQHIDIAERPPRWIRIADVSDRRTFQYDEPDPGLLERRSQSDEVPLQGQRAEHRFAMTIQELGPLVGRERQAPRAPRPPPRDRSDGGGRSLRGTPASLFVRMDREGRSTCRPDRTTRCGERRTHPSLRVQCPRHTRSINNAFTPTCDLVGPAGEPIQPIGDLERGPRAFEEPPHLGGRSRRAPRSSRSSAGSGAPPARRSATGRPTIGGTRDRSQADHVRERSGPERVPCVEDQGGMIGQPLEVVHAVRREERHAIGRGDRPLGRAPSGATPIRSWSPRRRTGRGS